MKLNLTSTFSSWTSSRPPSRDPVPNKLVVAWIPDQVRDDVRAYNPIIKTGIITRLAVATLHVCRQLLGFDTPVCLFEETCTPFAQHQLEERFLPIAIIIITWRLLRCNPITGLARWVKRNI